MEPLLVNQRLLIFFLMDVAFLFQAKQHVPLLLCLSDSSGPSSSEWQNYFGTSVWFNALSARTPLTFYETKGWWNMTFGCSISRLPFFLISEPSSLGLCLPTLCMAFVKVIFYWTSSTTIYSRRWVERPIWDGLPVFDGAHACLYGCTG